MAFHICTLRPQQRKDAQMALVECFEYVRDVCEPVPVWPGFAALYAEIQRATARLPATVQRRRMQAATWVVIALAVPVLCWDIWQTQRDVAARRQTSMQHAPMSTTASASVPEHRPRFRPW
jgi:hypothetical protein